MTRTVKEIVADGSPFKGETAHGTVKSLRAKIADKRREGPAIKSAPKGLDYDRAKFDAKLDAWAKTPSFNIVHTGDGFDVTFPSTTIDAEPNSARQPAAPDFRPGHVADHRDEIRAAGHKAIEEYYDGVRLVISSDDEKHERLLKIADEILTLERRECAVIWQAREEGEVIEFREDTDPRALLGIDGPPPTRRKRL